MGSYNSCRTVPICYQMQVGRSLPRLLSAAYKRRLSMTSPKVDAGGKVEQSIIEKLTLEFQPLHLEVLNESHRHNVPANSETHFKVFVVSSAFDSIKSLVQRHRLVNSTLEAELEGPVHALSIVAKSPTQWEKMVAEGKSEVSPSPNCRGGDGTLPKR